MPSMRRPRMDAAAALATGVSKPIGRRREGSSGTLSGFGSQMSSGEDQDSGIL